jgi:hypothetical protein
MLKTDDGFPGRPRIFSLVSQATARHFSPLQLFALMWSRADVIGLFSNNVVSFSRNVVLRGLSFSINVVPKPRMLSVRAVYVLSSLQLVQVPVVGDTSGNRP